jgi:NTE family protein
VNIEGAGFMATRPWSSRRFALVSAGLILAALLGGCGADNRRAELKTVDLNEIAPALPARQAGEPPRLGIAFGGGGVRGFSHLGVLRALHEAGLRADVVTGTSVGAIAAALHASDVPYPQLEQLVLSVRETDLLDPVFSRQGLLKGQALAAWIRSATGVDRIESLPVPLGIAVTELGTGEARIVTFGDLGAAVQASASVPGTVVPVRVGDDTLVDGGILSVVPVRAARALGADIVIGVDIYCGPPGPLKQHAVDTAFKAVRLQSCRLSEAEISEADILIRPAFEPDNAARFAQRQQSVEAGHLAARAQIPAIKALLDHHGARVP